MTTSTPRPTRPPADTRRSWMQRTAMPAAVLLAGYAGVRTYWQLGHRPDDFAHGPNGDLVAFTGWWSVALCVAGALATYGMHRCPAHPFSRRAVLAAGFATSIALIASGALLLLDVIGFLLPGLGFHLSLPAAASRLVCVGSGVLVAAATLSYGRESRHACPHCGRHDGSPRPLRETPMWAYVAAYVAVAGCVVRIAAQAVVGFDQNPLSSGPSLALFEGGFLLAGTLLPLALVHGWGRAWPRWVPVLSGRRIPLWLVLGPGAGLSAAIVVYFGLMLVMMVAERLHGRNPFPPGHGLDLPEVFFWFAVPAYLVWGCGMAVAAGVYFLRTRTTCDRCGR